MANSDPKMDIGLQGFHTIVDDRKLESMSSIVLADELSRLPKDSAKYLLYDREWKNRLAHDQARVNRANVLIAGGISIVGTLCGTILGWYLRNSPPEITPDSRSAIRQVPQANIDVHPNSPNTQKQHEIGIQE
jgi:hypothetical protein